MATTSNILKIEGFDELNRKLKQLPDRVKRTEVIRLQRQIAKPIIKAYSAALPVGDKDKKRFGKTYVKGTLSKSVKAETVAARYTGGNPSIVIRPGKKGQYDPWYRFMVVKKGTETGSIKKGSRTGHNTVVEEARDKALQAAKGKATAENADKTAKYIQKQIDRLSK